MIEKTEFPGIAGSDLPELIAGARVASASSLDEFAREVLSVAKDVDIRPMKSHIKP